VTGPRTDLPEVADVTLPVPHSTFVQLREAMAKPGEKPFTFGLNVDVHPFLGRFIVVGLREDYALAGARTYWVTLKWVAPRG
jgi:hypothetical protein